MIRQANIDDLSSIVELGIEALKLSDDGDLIIDELKIRQTAVIGISSPANFAWVSEHDNKIIGSLIALTVPMIFHKKMQASIIQFYCKKPGDGAKLLNKVIEWYEERPILRSIIFTLEHKCDERIIHLLNRKGFNQTFPVLMRTKNVKSC